MEPGGSGMSGKEIADNLKPGSGDFFLPQTAFKPELRCELLKQLADRDSPVSLLVGLG